MHRRTAASLAVLAVMPASALAQSTTTGSSITYTLHWDDTGNHNGIVEPGEGALISLDVSFSNQNTVATFSPPIGTFGSGTVRGLGSGFVDLNSNALAGNWNVDQNAGYGVSGDWDVTGGQGNGMPTATGRLLQNLQFGQFAASPGGINTTNPVLTIWSGVFTPTSYNGLEAATFTLAPSIAAGAFHSSVALRLSGSTVASAFVNAQFPSITIPGIPAIPAPSTAPLLTTLLLLRRRRR